MRSVKISNSNVTFYDILTKGINQLASYAGNANIVSVFRTEYCKNEYPKYASMINSNFKKGKRRRALLEQGNKLFIFIKPTLPYDCTEKIFSYLSNEDLRILIFANNFS